MYRLTFFGLILTLIASLFSSKVNAQEWSYSGENGPANWGSISPEFANCSSGQRQSHINIVPNLNGNLQPLDISYEANGTNISNNGRTVRIDFGSGSELVIGINRYELSQVHFHVPGEHQINGQTFAMEAHFAHTDSEGNIVVLAVLYAPGVENSGLNNALSAIPANSETNALSSPFNPAALLPEDLDYFQFVGSMTSPPCLEGLTWIVLKNTAQISAAQIEALSNAFPDANNRPVQAANGRVIVE